LQRACGDGLEILPVAVGRAISADVATVIEALEALVVVSTDLSHYLDRTTAERVDRETAEAVLRRDPGAIHDSAACGVHALRGLVEHARRRDLELELLDLRTSADTAGDPDRVVGYGAFALRGVA
jgi:AmmeMemoRadiSam system protein B